jgi:hypothetical protein
MGSAIAVKDIDNFFAITELKELSKTKNLANILLHGEEEVEISHELKPG